MATERKTTPPRPAATRAARKALAPKKPARIEARCSDEVKQTVQQAVALLGLNETDFVVSTIYREAVEAIKTHSIITLNAKDAAAFAHAIINPPAPNKAAVAAAKRYLTSRTPE